MKWIIELISNYVKISGNAIVDTVLFIIIGIIAFSVAFSLVGKIFDAMGFYDSGLMSTLHWIIRIAVFVGLIWVLIKVFEFFTYIASLDWWILVLGGTGIIIVIGIVIWMWKLLSDR